MSSDTETIMHVDKVQGHEGCTESQEHDEHEGCTTHEGRAYHEYPNHHLDVNECIQQQRKVNVHDNRRWSEVQQNLMYT